MILVYDQVLVVAVVEVVVLAIVVAVVAVVAVVVLELSLSKSSEGKRSPTPSRLFVPCLEELCVSPRES